MKMHLSFFAFLLLFTLDFSHTDGTETGILEEKKEILDSLLSSEIVPRKSESFEVIDLHIKKVIFDKDLSEKRLMDLMSFDKTIHPENASSTAATSLQFNLTSVKPVSIYPFESNDSIKYQALNFEIPLASKTEESSSNTMGSEPPISDQCSAEIHDFKEWSDTDSELNLRYDMYIPDNALLLLNKTLLEKYANRVHPHLPKKHSICHHKSFLEPDWDVSARSMCPFTWEPSSPNHARLPVLLMTARCSCTKPFRRHTAKCIEVKAKIPVLWRDGCNNGMHVYKQGFDVISVACAPVRYILESGLIAHRPFDSGLLEVH